jgi:hypothetical protein
MKIAPPWTARPDDRGEEAFIQQLNLERQQADAFYQPTVV